MQSPFLTRIAGWIRGGVSVIWPDECRLCHRPLAEGERKICLSCEMNLPRTSLHLSPFSEIHQRLGHRVRLERAGAFCYYIPGGAFASLIHSAKYRSEPGLARHLARLYAWDLLPSGFFSGIDAIVPVPLHFTKLLFRGYNQTHHMARGLAEVTGLPIKEYLVASRPHATQTHKSAAARRISHTGTFTLRHPLEAQGKHLLLIDDVLTTGATLAACAEPLLALPGTRLSVLTLGLAAH